MEDGMTAENIKGPWRRVGHRQIMDAEGAVVCEVRSSVGIQEANANECAIEATPDLVAAAQCFLKFFNSDDAETNVLTMVEDYSTLLEVQEKMRAAFAKATGAAA
jgi:hypothetical protein